VEAGQLPQAHETLEGIRDLLADLRRRNGVIVFSDHMNAYHAAMETLLEAGPQVLEGPKAFLELMARAGVLEYLAQRLLSEAPASLAGQPEFVARQRAVADAVAALRRAALAQDRDAAAAALKALKGPYSRLFLAFG